MSMFTCLLQLFFVCKRPKMSKHGHICLSAPQACWAEDPTERPHVEDIIIAVRGLLERALQTHKTHKTLAGTDLLRQIQHVVSDVATAKNIPLQFK